MADISYPLVIPNRPKPYLMAHRGNRVACPENTLAAFRRALVDGADILETDLHLTADGVFVCIHDATVDRTTDGHGPVAEMTLAQVKSLSASYGRPEFQGEQVPTLSGACRALARRCRVGAGAEDRPISRSRRLPPAGGRVGGRWRAAAHGSAFLFLAPRSGRRSRGAGPPHRLDHPIPTVAHSRVPVARPFLAIAAAQPILCLAGPSPRPDRRAARPNA